MKIKKIIAALLVGTLTATTVISASAVTLTDKNPDGSTEVKARIEGSQPGDVSYIITIPEKVDFGTLSQPTTDADSNKYIDFDVEATKLDIEARSAVSVFVKDNVSTDGQFYLTQQDKENPFTIPYDVYTALITNDSEVGENTPVNTSEPSEFGYHITTFLSNAEGETQDVTLALNQRELYGKNLDDIAGDYSGTMMFHTALTTIGG